MIVVTVVINVNIATQKSGLSDISLANVEALAVELPEVVITCGASRGTCWERSLNMCFVGEGSYWVCKFEGYTWAYCSTPCS